MQSILRLNICRPLFFAQENKRRKKWTDQDGERIGKGKGQRERTSTWNVSGIRDKEPEIIEFMRRWRVPVMGISECRRKGTGIQQVHEDYVLIWSGVNVTARATHGVGFILHPDTAKNVLETEFISERIIKIRVGGEQNILNFIQAYAPCNDTYNEEQKEEFFEKMADTLSTVPDGEELVVMGDFNGRVGKRRAPWDQHLGPHSDTNTECNYNGEQLLAL